MSTADDDNGQVLSPENWGQFNLYRAISAAERLLKGHAQHLAIILAFETMRRRCRNGVIEITHRELAALTGRGKDQIPVAMAECIEVGLLHGRRIMGGFKYTWGRVAYFPTEAANVVRRDQNDHSDKSIELRDAARRALRPEYLAALNHKYSIRSDSPMVPPLLALTTSQESTILDNWVYGAEAIGEPVESIAKKSLAKFFANDGKDGSFLKKAKHPLARFAEDVGLIVCNLVSFAEHLRRQGVETETRTSERVEHHVSLRPEVRRMNFEGSQELLRNMGIRRPVQRPNDFQLAANG